MAEQTKQMFIKIKHFGEIYKIMMRILCFSIIGLFIFSSCGPHILMEAKPIQDEKELPRYCLKERLLFYEVINNKKWVRLWIETTEKNTIKQLIGHPLHIYLATGKKSKVRYHMRYRNVFDQYDKAEKTASDSVKLKLFRLNKLDTVDVTSDYNFRIQSDFDNKRYTLKIDFPAALVKSLAEPVMGFRCSTPAHKTTGGEEKISKKTRNHPQSSHSAMHQRNRYSSFQNQPPRNNQSADSHYRPAITDIEVWFRLKLKSFH